MKQALSILLAAFALSACRKQDMTPPQADFFVEKNPYEGSFSFKAVVNRADVIKWESSDGWTSWDYNPSHDFTENGTFEVTLTASNSYGETKATKQIVVDDVTETGKAMIYVSNQDHGVITLYTVDSNGYHYHGELWGSFSYPPGCGESGGLTITLPVGTYGIHGIAYSMESWDTTVTITPDGCTTVQLF